VTRLLEQATALLDSHDAAAADMTLVSELQITQDCAQARRLLSLGEQPGQLRSGHGSAAPGTGGEAGERADFDEWRHITSRQG
jgi:hypothetical protein